jgi:tetratricopeptide (TPR) repeat protein
MGSRVVFRLAVFMALLLSPTIGRGQTQTKDKDHWIGRRVILRYGTVLKVGDTVVDDGRRALHQSRGHDKSVFRIYRVREVNGNWLWLVPEKAGQSGWVATGSVIAVDEAISHFTDEIRADPKNAIHYVNRGMIWMEIDEYDIAIKDFSQAIQLSPRNDVPYLDRGQAWALKNNLDKAIADFNEAIRLDPDDALNYQNRGSAWSEKREFDKATADFNEALRLHPQDAETHLHRGWALVAKKEYAQALDDFNEAIRIEPRDGFYYNNRAWFSATCPDPSYRDGKRAVQSATHACQLSGWKDAFNLGTLAAAYAETGDFASAIKYQEQAQPLYAEENDRRDGLARLELFRQGKPYRLGLK